MSQVTIVDNRYEITALIAEGMMGPVYRGLDRKTGRPVALKALRPEILTDQPSLLERFRREGEALRQLNHPNIVHCLDVVREGDMHYLIMDYIEGGSLRELLSSQSPLPVKRVLEIGLDVADALVRAHRLGIVHRDLKPENVLLSADGTPRLSDFGVAHYIHQTTVSPQGGFAGTWCYIPPESFHGLEVDERADIWSFGVLLFEMLAGRVPFEAETAADLIGSVLTRPMPDLRGLRPELPPDLYDLIEMMLVKNREARISSVRLVGAALEAINKGQKARLPVGVVRPPQPVAIGNLPVPPTTFIGRERERREIVTLLSDPTCRLVTLTGPGGVGKTRLAIQAAGESGYYYVDGVYFVDLAPISSPALVAGRIARTLGIKEAPSRSLVEDIVEWVGQKQCLLYLDNFEQVIAAAPIVSKLMASAPGLDILITSREALQLYGEHVYPVPPLSLPDQATTDMVGAWPVITDAMAALSGYEAVALFVQRARAADPGFRLDKTNARAVVEICIRLDGLPLAIELAAARIRLFSPTYLLERLDDVLGTLAAGPRDSAARHQTLRAAIDWSYDLLSEEERRLFYRLAVFHGGRSLKGIEAVCGLEPDVDLIVGLSSLLNKSLLRREDEPEGEPRFVMLETIHQYARERMETSGEAELLRQRHADYYVALAEQGEPELRGPRQNKWSAIIRREYDNLRAALTWTLEGADPVTGSRMAGALAEFWFYEGPISEGETWIGRASRWIEDVPPPIGAKVLNGAGMLAFAYGDHVRGKQWNRRALEMARAAGDKYGWAWALFWLSAHATVNPDEYPEGIALCEKCLELFEEIDDKAGMAWGYNQLGEMTRLIGDFDRARVSYEKSIAICRESGNKRREAIAQVNMGYVAQHQADYERAENHILDGLSLLQDLKLKYHSAIALSMLAGPVVATGRAERATRLLGASDAIIEHMAVGLQPADRVEIDQYIMAARQQLDETTFARAWSEGRAMSYDEVISFAFEGR